MTTLKHTLIFSLLFLFSGQLFATHIVGGGITYECIGTSANSRTYRFTMKVYRDCLNGTAQFDNPANIAIYRGSFQSNTLLASFTVPLGPVVDVGVNQPDCIDNLPIICLEEATYTWESTLDISNQSYFVEYQRCCRTNAIVNIVNPSNTGTTYSVEITPNAQQLCNSSPVFNNFPPVIICNNYPLEVDYSATDPDGDQLVYSFCAPYSGGSQGGGGCNAPQPNPPCPPPFNSVVFIAPNYSSSQPMGGNPVIKINAQSGVISGTPHLNGQFVVGVCVEEYRNGVLLSITRRDFQFNVAPCAPQVSALVEYDDITGPQQYVIKQCSTSKRVTIVNQSSGGSSITDFEWTFDLQNGNIIQNSTDFDLTVNFPAYGTYNGTLILNQGLDCGDTAYVQVQLYPPSILDLGPDVKICKDSTITLDAGTGFTGYTWQNGQTTRTISASTSGLYFVAAVDSCGDIHRDSVKVTISPVPNVALADASVCPGGSVTLDVPGFETYAWSPASGLSCTNCPMVTVQPGANTTYTFLGTNQDGCAKLDTFDITVLPTPMQTYVIKFYPNQSVTLGGQMYNQPGTVMLTVPSTTGGCDSLNTYVLELLPTTLDIQCPANITVAIPSNATTAVANYALPTATTDCPGPAPSVQLSSGLASGSSFPAGINSVCYEAKNDCGDSKSCCFTVTATTLDIQCPANITVPVPNNATTVVANYLAPTTTSNCPDPAMVTLLQGLASGSSFPIGVSTVCYQATNSCGNTNSCCFTVTGTTLGIQCPANQTVQLPIAATSAVVNYAAPTTTSNCPSPTSITLLQGQASGGNFPIGANSVCYQASNSCGNVNSCCFTITVQDAPSACDIKNIDCMRFELLDIRLDSITQPRYRIRATNFCPTEISYILIQTPNGLVAVTPVEGSTYTAPNTGNKYLVRSPNESPFYSVRYRPLGAGLKNGEADVFEYRLPQQTLPQYIHMGARLKNGIFYEAYLNTFYCPVQPWSGSKPADFNGRDSGFDGLNETGISIRPNPTDGVLFLDLNQWQQQTVQVQVLNAQGQVVTNQLYDVDAESLELNLDARLSNGLYYLVVRPANGLGATVKFVLAR